MKILHINNNFLSTPMHANLLDELKKNFNIDVFCPISNKTVIRTKYFENVYSCLCFSSFDHYFYFSKQRKMYMAMKKQCNLPSYSLIHAFTLFTDCGLAYKISKEYNIPFITSVRTTDLKMLKVKPYLSVCAKRMMAAAKCVVFLSRSLEINFFKKLYGKKIPESLLRKTKIIPNGVDDFWLENISRHAKDLNTIRVICAGRVDKNKNLATTCKAINLLKKRGINLTFTVIGEKNSNRIIDKILKYDFVDYKGAVGKDSLIQFFRASDIFVMPSFSETFGLVYVEAMSQGLPVIYSRGQGFDGQFSEGDVGYSTNPHDYRELADDILNAFNNYDNISHKCVELVNRFNWLDISCKYSNIYHTLDLEEH